MIKSNSREISSTQDKLQDKITPLVRTKLSDHLAQQNVALIDLETEKRIDRDFSHIFFYKATTSQGINKYVLKKVIHHEINLAITKTSNQAQVEFGILSQLSPKFLSVEGCDVPKPILVIPEEESYLMEFVEGEILIGSLAHARYFTSLKKYQKLLNDMYLCGKWLSSFHKITGSRTAQFSALENVVGRLSHRIELIETSYSDQIPIHFARQVSKKISDLLTKIDKNNIQIWGRHGDFTPYNILTNTSGITVIDFLGYEYDLNFVDIMKFLIFLEDTYLSPTISPMRLRNIKKEFMRGYGELPDAPLPIILLCEAMQRAVSLWGQLSRACQWPHHKIEKQRIIKSHCQWLMALPSPPQQI